MSDYRAQAIRIALIRALAQSEPPDRPREILDSAAGLILRHQPTGYLGLYAFLGRGKRERLCNARDVIDPTKTLTLQMVKTEAKRLQGKSAGGHNFKADREKRRAVPTLETFIAETYGPWARINRRSAEATLDRLDAQFSQTYGNLQLDQITPARLERWRIQRQKAGIAPETINRDVAALKGVLTRAVRLELIDQSPLCRFEAAKTDPHKQPQRALTASEKEALLDALAERDNNKRQKRASGNRWRRERGYAEYPEIGQFAGVLTPAVITSLESGLRRGELLGLEWPSVDLERKSLRVEGTTSKTYETREIPLNGVAFKTLRDWWLQRRQPESGYVFTVDGGRLGNLKKAYYSLLEAAGIERINARGDRITWHSLRHTFGSLLGAEGVDPTTLMKLMGHANLTTTQRYLHTDEERKRVAVSLLERREAS